MGKGTVFVILYSLVILVLFGVFCYLITTVDPAPLETYDKNDSRRASELDLNSIFLNDKDVVLGEAEYGLEKAKKSYKLVPSKSLITTNSVLPLNPLELSLSVSCNTANSSITDKYTVKPKSTNTEKIFSKLSNRRSIYYHVDKNHDTDSVALKVLSENGEPRIEIKLGANSSIVRKKSQQLPILLVDDVKLQNRDAAIYTVIKLMPNDTVIINEIEYDVKTKGGGELNDSNGYTNENNKKTLSTHFNASHIEPDERRSAKYFRNNITESEDGIFIIKLKNKNGTESTDLNLEKHILNVIFDRETKPVIKNNVKVTPVS